MKLNRLTLKNFKGIKNFNIEPQGQDVIISGENATGKTTVFDAFRWLLDGKDSQNRKDFEIKTLSPDGEPIHGLDHEVEAELDLGEGKTKTLKKTYREDWVKKRGAAESTFSGHTIDHHIDGVPVKQKEYDEAINQIAPAEVFMLLTDPRYFNAALHWKRRREILLEVCGDVPDAEVIASNKKLARLPEVLGDRSTEEHRKVIAEKRKEIQKELDRIPVRIDEVTQGLPDLTEVDKEAHKNNLKVLSSLLESAAQRALDLESGGRAAEVRQRLAELKAEAQEKLAALRADADEKIDAAMKRKTELSRENREAENAVADLKAKIKRTEAAISAYEKSIQELRNKWTEIDVEEYTPIEGEDICPTCGHALPEEKVNAMQRTAIEQFNQEKAARLEKISAEGKETRAELEEAQQELTELKAQLTEAENKAEAILGLAQSLQAEIADAMKLRDDQERSEKYQEIQEKIKVNQEELTGIQAGNSEAITGARQEVADLKAKIAVSEEELYKFVQHDAGQARIKELKDQERKLAGEYESLEQELFLTEEFIKTKVGLLEERINGKFEHATFKMFETYISGGVEPVCETLYQGVPYGTSLNNGARINIGLDIIRTLAEHYQFDGPIFIDNAEAVTRLIEMPSQIIKLVVGSEKELKVVMETA